MLCIANILGLINSFVTVIPTTVVVDDLTWVSPRHCYCFSKPLCLGHDRVNVVLGGEETDSLSLS